MNREYQSINQNKQYPFHMRLQKICVNVIFWIECIKVRTSVLLTNILSLCTFATWLPLRESFSKVIRCVQMFSKETETIPGQKGRIFNYFPRNFCFTGKVWDLRTCVGTSGTLLNRMLDFYDIIYHSNEHTALEGQHIDLDEIQGLIIIPTGLHLKS